MVLKKERLKKGFKHNNLGRQLHAIALAINDFNLKNHFLALKFCHLFKNAKSQIAYKITNKSYYMQ